MNSNRRCFIKALSAGLMASATPGVAATLLGQTSKTKKKDGGGGDQRVTVDVAIVGAGYSGITAALELKKQGKSVRLLEAHHEIGGRSRTETHFGMKFDVGGQWLGSQQKRMLALTNKYNIPLFETYEQGESMLEETNSKHQKEIRKYSGTIPSLGLLSTVDLGKTLAQLDYLAKKVNLNAPWASKWLTKDAADYDSMSFMQWIDKNVYSAEAKRVLVTGMQMVFSAHPSDISFLHALFYIKSGVNTNTLISARDGAQAYRFLNGTHDLLHKLAAPLHHDIVTSSPVRAIEQRSDGVVLRSDQETVFAKRVIVACPPAVQSKIDFSPMLSPARRALQSAMPMGKTIKFLIFYPKAFWREAGMSGAYVSSFGPIAATYDNGVPGFKEGVLVAFAVGSHAERLHPLSEEKRQKIVLAQLAKAFGPQALKPTKVIAHTWMDEPFVTGCYVGVMRPNGWMNGGKAIRQVEGKIHWAGTETATEWNGYYEGAVQAGMRAAAEIKSTDL